MEGMHESDVTEDYIAECAHCGCRITEDEYEAGEVACVAQGDDSVFIHLDCVRSIDVIA